MKNRRLPVQILISLFKDFFLFSKPIKKKPFKIIFSSEKYRQSWIRVKKKKSKFMSMSKRKCEEDVVEGAKEHTTKDREGKFMERLRKVLVAFNSDSDFIGYLWEGFDPKKTDPILNPREIVLVLQNVMIHFESLPKAMQEYCLDNLSVFNDEEFYPDVKREKTTAEHTTVPAELSKENDRKQKFIARLNEVIMTFNGADSCIADLWDSFIPTESNPMLNPDEMADLFKIIIKHFDFLPTEMKEYFLDNLSVFNAAKFYSDMNLE